MAGSYNHITLVGRLTRDPEIRYVQSGSAVTSFAIAVNRRTKQGEEAMFVDIVAWDSGNRKLAEVCNTYLKKGMTVLIDGRLAIRSYETKEGEKRKVTEVVANDMQMLDSKGSSYGGDGGGGGYARGTSPNHGDEGAASGGAQDAEDEVPF
ncbi:MAG: single-stranded DNA-binding protein [Candidatus Baltobacteraceae bacterium]